MPPDCADRECRRVWMAGGSSERQRIWGRERRSVLEERGVGFRGKEREKGRAGGETMGPSSKTGTSKIGREQAPIV